MKRLEWIWQLKRVIQNLNQKTIAEIKSFNIPLPEIQIVMRSVFLLLGDSPKTIATWMDIKVMIGKTGKESLKRRISTYVVAFSTASSASVALASKLLQGIEVNRIAEVSKGCMAFYAWATGCLEEIERTGCGPH